MRFEPAALYSPALPERDDTGVAVVVVAEDGAVLEVLYVDGDFMRVASNPHGGGLPE